MMFKSPPETLTRIPPAMFPLRYCIWLYLIAFSTALGAELPPIFRDAPPFKGLKADDMAWRMNLWHYGVTAEGGAYIVVHDDKFEIWYKASPAERWQRIVRQVCVIKTFGGLAPRLACEYLGNGFFAYSETIANSKVERSGNGPEPTMLAITKLVDRNGKVVAQTEAYRYGGQPGVKIPAIWSHQFKLNPEQPERSDHPVKIPDLEKPSPSPP